MTAYSDYPSSQTGRIVVKGQAPIVVNRKVITATNVIPGRLAVRASSDGGIKVGDGVSAPVGWVGYEQSDEIARPADMTTAFGSSTQAPVLSGGSFAIQGWTLAGTYVQQGELMASFIDGCVMPAEMVEGRLYLKYPYSKHTGETSTYMVFPAGVVISDVKLRITTAVSGSTLDVGLLSSEGGGDANGFLAQESGYNGGTTGIVIHNLGDTTQGLETPGALLNEVELVSSDGGAIYYNAPTLHVCDGTAKTLTYSTSSHAVVGYILVCASSPGIKVVGKAAMTVDASLASTATACIVESEL